MGREEPLCPWGAELDMIEATTHAHIVDKLHYIGLVKKFVLC